MMVDRLAHVAPSQSQTPLPPVPVGGFSLAGSSGCVCLCMLSYLEPSWEAELSVKISCPVPALFLRFLFLPCPCCSMVRLASYIALKPKLLHILVVILVRGGCLQTVSPLMVFMPLSCEALR